MTETLIRLFGTEARLRLLRMFLFNENASFGVNEILRRAKLARRTGRTELNQLERADILKKKFVMEEDRESGRMRRVVGYTLNPASPIVGPLRIFLFATAPINGRTLQKHLRGVGKIDVLIAAGVFMKEFDRRLDVLLAVPQLKQSKIEMAIRNLEAELGIEIKFTALSTDDLKYRVGMQDKLTRDIFDYPHEILIDKIGIVHDIRR